MYMDKEYKISTMNQLHRIEVVCSTYHEELARIPRHTIHWFGKSNELGYIGINSQLRLSWSTKDITNEACYLWSDSIPFLQ